MKELLKPKSVVGDRIAYKKKMGDVISGKKGTKIIVVKGMKYTAEEK